ncbi:MAG: hypothetical protein BroJett024_42940 [Alphaproteobacteria bacterium]|nr:MAG: hypothetical protein BroJett024_42940 [Alphaproteobacteria bacterium]
MTERPQQPKKGGRGRPATRKGAARAAAPAPKGMGIALSPGLRQRLFKEMDGARIPREGRLQYLCSMTGRKPQTARRWIENDRPGLPDLESFAAICGAFDADANWMLGLTNVRYPLPRVQEHGAAAGNARDREERNLKWIDYVTRQLAEHAEGCETFYMPGDDMEPRIPNGAPILVDTGTKEIVANGTYLLEYQRRTMVRNVESRIGEGLVLSCENRKYKESVVKDAAAAKRMGLKVLGRLKVAIVVDKL